MVGNKSSLPNPIPIHPINPGRKAKALISRWQSNQPVFYRAVYHLLENRDLLLVEHPGVFPTAVFFLILPSSPTKNSDISPVFVVLYGVLLDSFKGPHFPLSTHDCQPTELSKPVKGG